MVFRLFGNFALDFARAFHECESVRSVTKSVAQATWRGYGSRNGGEVPGDL